jgi:hypothetical protein
MTDARQAWSDAGHQISALTARLKEAFEQQRAAEARQAGEGPEAGGTSAVPDGAAETGSTAPSGPSGGGAAKAEVQEAVRRLSEAAKDVFEVLGGAAKDPNVKADVKHVGNSVSTAFAATFTEIAEQVRKTGSKTPGRSAPGSSGSAGSSPSTASTASTGETSPSQTPPADASPPPPYRTPPEGPSAGS